LSDSSHRAIVFDIQRFSLHDGPGIRTTVFFKGCPLSCRWCQNPESIKNVPEIAFYEECCRSCFECNDACYEDAIVIAQNKSRIDYSKCNGCGDCAHRCPHRALRLIGNAFSPEALVEEIIKDKEFFIDSGGGVTLSGGEPMIYPSFLETLLPMIKEQGIHINMETSGCFKWDQILKILPRLDLIYFDLKHMDGTTHKQITGKDNRPIQENFKKLSKAPVTLQARMPVIPGINDDHENIMATATFIKRQGHHRIHCLPYHNWGEVKIARIGSHLRSLHLKPLGPDDLVPVSRFFSKEGIDAVIYD